MKRRYATTEGKYNIKIIDDDYFKGYVNYVKLENIKEPLIVNNGNYNVCIKDNKYFWIEVYPDKGNYVITIMFDDKDNLIEWYFDVSKKVGIENKMPYEDDLYLDMVITKDKEKIILDENELIDAYNRKEITKEDLDNAYKTIEYLENKYYNNFSELKNLTDYLLKMKDNYICKIPSLDEMNKKWNYEIEHAKEDKDNWIIWKEKAINNFKNKISIPYYGILDGNIICEATALLDKEVVQNSEGLVDNDTVYLTAFRTVDEYQGKGYFSKFVIKSNLSQVDSKSIQQSINFNLSLLLYNWSII